MLTGDSAPTTAAGMPAVWAAELLAAFTLRGIETSCLIGRGSAEPELGARVERLDGERLLHSTTLPPHAAVT